MADKTIGSVLYSTDGSRVDYDTAANLDSNFRDVSAETAAVRAELGASVDGLASRVGAVEAGTSGGGALPPGGTSGQTIVKQSDGSAAWADPKGTPGRGITSIVASTTDPTTATVTYTDGTTAELTLPQGAAGRSISSFGAPDGEGVSVVTFSDGSTTTITLPKGDRGDAGPRGLQGPQGDSGPANALTIGTVTGGAAAGATLTGEAPDQTLSLVLPQGAKGDRGDPGAQGPPGVVSSASSYVIVGPGRPDAPTTTAGTITGAEPVGAEYRSTDGASVGAWTWTRRPGGKWHVTNGDSGWRDVTAQTWVHETNTYAVPGDARSGTVIRLTTTGMDLIVRGSGGGTNPGVTIAANQHLRVPVLRSLLPAQFTWNSYSSLPHGLREYYGDISIQWGRAPAAVWFLPRDPAAWPTTLPGTPA